MNTHHHTLHRLCRLPAMERTQELNQLTETEIGILATAAGLTLRPHLSRFQKLTRLNDHLATTPASQMPAANYKSDFQRRRDLITKGSTVPEPVAREIVTTVAETLQSLSRGTPTIHAAPPREDLHERLRHAAQVAKHFTHSTAA